MTPPHAPDGRARPPGAPRRPQRKKLPHERPLWIRPEDKIFFITICCRERTKNQLCQPEIARVIFESVEFRNRNEIWWAHLIALMPDHLHALISFPFETAMKQIITDWKRFLATKLKIEWQRDFFDHRLRREESFQETADYIRANPVRAGLVGSAEEWPYFWHARIDEGEMRDKLPARGAPGGRALPLLLIGALTLVGACRRDMANQPKAKPLSESEFFADGTNARPLPPHTIARDAAQKGDAFETGLVNGVYVTQLPMKLTPQLLARGRERYDAFCSMCHGRVGDGQGIVVQRGFPAPPSYHVDRLRDAPIGHFFDVITNGYGAMTSYASQIEPQDRWAITAYIRALQLSQNAKTSDLPTDARSQLERQP